MAVLRGSEMIQNAKDFSKIKIELVVFLLCQLMKFDDFFCFDLLACSREFCLLKSLQHIEILVSCKFLTVVF
jgi:hypothetical protein